MNYPDALPVTQRQAFDGRRFLTVLVRPDVAFALIWAAVFAAYELRLAEYFPDANWKVTAMIAGSLALGVGSAILWPRLLPQGAPLALPDPVLLKRAVFVALAVWIVGFVAIVVYSGGMPIYWYPAGIPKTYVDYGMPTFSGAWNTFRVVIAIVATLYLVTRPKLDIAVSLVLVFLTATVICEINRGGFILYAFNVLAAGVLVAPNLRRQVAWVVVVSIVSLASIYGMGAVRATDAKAAHAISGAFTRLDGSAVTGTGAVVAQSQAASWVYLYLTTPIANLHYAATLDLQPSPSPAFHTLYPMLPSVIRPVMPEESRYPLPLLVGGYTMTTAYGPFVADFGFLGASIAMGLQLAIGTLVFTLARRHLWALILAPMFFATVALSFFTNYFFTLLMPFHAALAVGAWLVLVRPWKGAWPQTPKVET